MTSERWLPIAGYEGLYEVSDLGRVRSLDRRDSRGNQLAGTIRKLGVMKGGHLNVTLCKGGKQRTFYVHRLVLETFVGACPEGMEGLHGDGVPSNNRLANLRWGTSLENSADAERHGTVARGEANGRSRLTEKQVLAVRAAIGSHRSIAARFGISQGSVSRLKNKIDWRHL
ncbi:NUMOD4 motif-containing HNH endonuclease [Sphingomonas sp. ACRSK]|uniref:NUMOD4 motif-containing HNH endonuclease n=1 Tax=Sphingomonas sp. ACRSK TaxID=2918213 RepID=UPI001EF5CACD|nr:NUMOD4 motif-containing HNH endonuclease [Sphingomonas sp. ACRSK]MCG7348905.1 NUMOD4 motif-containing HNH endonuclease [Sphingomonas sp. ACRSK]